MINNFLKTVEGYKYELKKQLERDFKHNPHIVHQEGNHKGKLKFPVLSGIILDVPNKGYTKEEIAQRLALSPLNCFILFSEIDTIESFLKNIPKPFLGEEIMQDTAKEIVTVLFPMYSKTTNYQEKIRKYRKIFEKNFYLLTEIQKTTDHFQRSKLFRENILSTMDYTARLLSTAQESINFSYPDILREIEREREELEKEKFKIAVFGNFSCGKSTFLNALMRIDKLPVKEERATAVFTVLRNAEEHGKQHGEAEIHFKDKDFLRADIVEGIKELGMTAELELDKQEQIYEYFEGLSPSEVQHWIDKVEKIKVRNFDADQRKVVRAYKQILRSILTKVFKNKEIRPGTVKNISPQEASKYITSQEYSDLIHHIVYYLDNDLLKKVEIIDTPGLGSSDYTHTLRTQSFIKEANFAILLVEAEKPMQNESEIKFLDLLEKEGKINQLIVIVNKVDRSEKDIQTIKNLMRREIEDTFEGDIEIPDERIFFLSSEYFFLKQNPAKNQEKLKALEKHKNVDPNALDKFEYYYKTSLTKEKDKILLEDKERFISNQIEYLHKAIQKKVAEKEADLKKVEEKR